MLCSVCRHCGLCQGDGLVISEKPLITSSDFSFYTDCVSESFSDRDIGIAIDIGTTTLALCAVQLSNVRVLARCGQENAQRVYGSDVVSRIHFALKEEALALLHKSITEQLSRLCQQLLRDVSALFLAERKGPVQVKRMTFTGNTAMLSILCNMDVSGLATFPFSLPHDFGFECSAKKILTELSSDFDECRAYIPPVLSAFVGADTVCAVLSCGLLKKDKCSLLCDVGTNCEMALYDPSKNILWSTSAAAGPAFEAYGISCGMPACEGAIARVLPSKDKSVNCEIIGGLRAKGLCGTGLLSAVSTFLTQGRIDSSGQIVNAEEIVLCDEVKLLQKDIRELQLAKAALRTGFDFLCLQAQVNAKELEELFVAGGFGTSLNEHDACVLKMFPSECEKKVCHAGNASLAGAVMLLVNESYRKECEDIKSISSVINLAQRQDFNEHFMASLNF